MNVMPFSVASETRNETADVQIRFTPNDRHQTEARNMRLLTDRFIVVMRPDHPAVGRKMTPELYASLHHVKLSQAATGCHQTGS